MKSSKYQTESSVDEEVGNGKAMMSKSEVQLIASDPSHSDYDAVSAALMHMAVCHTVIIDPKKGTYNASSPDELALVEGAKFLGFEFLSLNQDNIISIRVPHS